MSIKERLERELEQLKKTYKTGIIKTDEYERARKKIDAKLAEQIKQTKNDDESKQIISDILDGKDELYDTDSKTGSTIGTEKIETYSNTANTYKAKEGKRPIDYGAYEEYYLNNKDNDKKNETDEKEPENKKEQNKEKENIAAAIEIPTKEEINDDKDKEKYIEEEQIEDITEEKETITKDKEIYLQKKEKEEIKKETKKEGKKHKENKKEEKIREKHKAEKDKKEKEDEEEKEDEDKSAGKRYFYISILIIIVISAIIFALMTSLSGDTSTEAKIEKNLTNATGTANIDFYYSYSCKPCYRTFITLESIKATYGDYVNVNYRHFPLDIEADAIMDNAAECAKEEGVFINYSKKLFNAKKPVTEESAILLFENTGINDTANFRNCVKSKAKLKSIATEYKASLASTIDNLPSVIINGSIIAGEKPISIYETIIDDEIGLR